MPDKSDVAQSNVEVFRTWLATDHGISTGDYRALHRWSIDDPDRFWALLSEYFDIARTGSTDPVHSGDEMPHIAWFPNLSVNYAEQVLRHCDRPGPAILDDSEPGGTDQRAITWSELRRQVGAIANSLRQWGVRPGDRVVGYLPNIAEAVVAMLATASLGAVWSSCGQDYSPAAAADRLGQLDPLVLITADGYRYAGKLVDRRPAVRELRGSLPTVRHTIVVERAGLGTDETHDVTLWSTASAGEHDVEPVRVPFGHPLWVLYSSGTTGRPKGIVHGHGGVLLEHLKQMSFHLDLRPGDVYFWYTSPSWMMWNFQVAGLLVGAAIVTYDGSPTYPSTDAVWCLAAKHSVAVLGSSPAYLQACEKSGVRPGDDFDLSSLRTLGATGSVLAPGAYDWVADAVGPRVALASTTGGTDVVSAFAGFVPTEPIRAGELTAPCLGVALEAWDCNGKAVVDQVGEMVITSPLPSMPLYFWNDKDGSRYRAAYFDSWPGVWRHGDWVTITTHGTVVVHGRSDATLNRHGVRMGSADIYEPVEKLAAIRESIVLGVEYPDGSYWMPLFVVLAEGVELDDDLRSTICDAIRTGASPRHVPDDIIEVPGIPHTRTGKKLEVPLKRLMQGAEADAVVDRRSVDDPTLIDVFAVIASQRRTPDLEGARSGE